MLAVHVTPSEPTQFVMDQGHELVEGGVLTLIPGEQ
jgi:hypothetical protein